MIHEHTSDTSKVTVNLQLYHNLLISFGLGKFENLLHIFFYWKLIIPDAFVNNGIVIRRYSRKII